MIDARIICDSVSPQGHRLTTFQLRYPKFIHGEFMTHRVFSRNASSSRAVPVAKSIEEVRSDALRAAPVFWGKNQPGMQAHEELSYEPLHDGSFSPRAQALILWRDAAIMAAGTAGNLAAIGAHKQIVNRVLEPYLHINVVCTATEYMNFFGLRLHEDAQPEMRALAEAMRRAHLASWPMKVGPGEWHLPFISIEDDETILQPLIDSKLPDEEVGELSLQTKIQVSVARCARVSYTSFETGKRSTVEEDLKLYERLVGSHPMHASPAEHQATPDEPIPPYLSTGHDWKHRWQQGNFVGWRQYRKMLPGEAVAPMPEEKCSA